MSSVGQNAKQDAQNESTSDQSAQDPLLCLRDKHGKKETQPSEKGSVVASPVAPVGPIVSFVNGMLTVEPQNAALRDVLRAIGSHAGVTFDLPLSGLQDRIFDRIGPVSLSDAITQLLYGSGLNYIMQTAPDNPQDVKRVFVTAKANDPKEMTNHSQPQVEVVTDNQAFLDPSQDEPPPAPIVEQMPARAGNVPGVPTGFNLKQAAAEAHKTPAEILDELQKRQLEILDAQAPPQ